MNYKIKFQELREYHNLSQAKLANLLKISKSTYNQYEQQYAIIPSKRLNDVANIFDCSLDYIFSFNDIQKYENSVREIDNYKAGLRLKEFRMSHKNLTQEKLAMFLNTEHQVISSYEKGKQLICTAFLYDICKKYNMSADYLLGKIDYIPNWCSFK